MAPTFGIGLLPIIGLLVLVAIVIPGRGRPLRLGILAALIAVGGVFMLLNVRTAERVRLNEAVAQAESARAETVAIAEAGFAAAELRENPEIDQELLDEAQRPVHFNARDGLIISSRYFVLVPVGPDGDSMPLTMDNAVHLRRRLSEKLATFLDQLATNQEPVTGELHSAYSGLVGTTPERRRELAAQLIRENAQTLKTDEYRTATEDGRDVLYQASRIAIKPHDIVRATEMDHMCSIQGERRRTWFGIFGGLALIVSAALVLKAATRRHVATRA